MRALALPLLLLPALCLADSGLVTGRSAGSGIVEYKASQEGNVLSQRELGPGGARETRKPLAPVPAPAQTAEPAAAPEGPDVGRMRALLREGRFGELQRMIESVQRLFPDWEPPAELVKLARAGALRARLGELAAQGREAEALAFYRAHPEVVDCANLPVGRFLARALASELSNDQAVALVERLLKCPGDDERLATLEESRAWLPPETLLELLEGGTLGEADAARVQRLRYGARVDRLLAVQKAGDAPRSAALFAELADDAVATRDAGTVLIGAWANFQNKDVETAERRFGQVLAWDPEAHGARVGLALCALARSRFDEALQLAQALPADHAERAALLRDVRLGQAQRAYNFGRHEEALARLDEAAQQGALPRYARAMRGWARLETGGADKAAAEFVALYGEAPDKESAEGVMNALTRLGRDDEVDRLATGEPLKTLWRLNRAERAFIGKRFLAAGALDPARYGEAGGIGVPRAALQSGYRVTDGSSGVSRLAMDTAALEAAWGTAGSGDWRLRLERLKLDTGNWNGTGRLGSAAGIRAFSATSRVDGWLPSIAWRDDVGGNWEAELGATSSGAPAGQTGVGLVARTWTRADSATRLELHRAPVRDSMLSYVGMRDPYSGRSWGQVTRNGLLANHRMALGGRWSASLQAQADAIEGREVAGNRRLALDASMGYALPVENFDYAVLAFGASTDRFARNLAGYTLGHGGYFSPQRYWRVGPSFDFMTQENRPYMLRGRISIGRTGKQENDAPVFPLADDGQRTPGSAATAGAREFEIGGTWQIGDRLQAGAWVAFRHSLQYDTHAALFFVRFLLEPRRSVLSSDLPNAAGARLF
ncbi:MAG: cellulose synthase subunit BcsC-related outer membrane protein [Ignavibacteria bacterium]